MNHPLTDKMIDQIFNQRRWWEAPDNVFCLRDAYDLGESKGRADMLDEVIEWLNKVIFEDNMFFEDSLLSSDIDRLPRRLQEAMRPQEDN